MTFIYIFIVVEKLSRKGVAGLPKKKHVEIISDLLTKNPSLANNVVSSISTLDHKSTVVSWKSMVALIIWLNEIDCFRAFSTTWDNLEILLDCIQQKSEKSTLISHLVRYVKNRVALHRVVGCSIHDMQTRKLLEFDATYISEMVSRIFCCQESLLICTNAIISGSQSLPSLEKNTFEESLPILLRGDRSYLLEIVVSQ